MRLHGGFIWRFLLPQPDSRFEHVASLIRKGVFGWADFFEPLVDSVTTGADYYLLANDFPSYIDAQVIITVAPLGFAGAAREGSPERYTGIGTPESHL